MKCVQYILFCFKFVVPLLRCKVCDTAPQQFNPLCTVPPQWVWEQCIRMSFGHDIPGPKWLLAPPACWEMMGLVMKIVTRLNMSPVRTIGSGGTGPSPGICPRTGRSQTYSDTMLYLKQYRSAIGSYAARMCSEGQRSRARRRKNVRR